MSMPYIFDFIFLSNQGAQPGHTGKSRVKMESDEVVNVSLPSTCDCGGSINLSIA